MMNNYYFSKDFYVIKKKLKFLVEVTLETSGNIIVSPKLALLLTQNGLYENQPIFDYIQEYFSFIKIFDIDREFIFNVSFIFVFTKKNEKTLIYVLNPFTNSFLNSSLKINFLDIYITNKYNIYKFKKNNYLKKKIYFYNYIYFFKKIRSKFFISNLDRKNYIYYNKKKYFNRYFLAWKRYKFKRVRRKNKCKKQKYLKYLKFKYLFKVKKWYSYVNFFKVIVLSSYYFSDDFSYLKLKLFLYTYISFFSLYKNWFIKKFRRKFNYKKKFGRNKYGELMIITRNEFIKKKKK